MLDHEIISPENLSYFCNTNEGYLTGQPRGIVLEVPGLGGGSCLGGVMDMRPYETPYTKALAEAGLVIAYTFPGPWSYMNRGAVRICDLIVDALRTKYSLSDHSPLIVSGGSMGGLGALIYTADSRHTVTACVAACPRVEASSTAHSFPWQLRGLVSAIAAYEMPLEEALHTISPRHRVSDMPCIPYFIVCDDEDEVCKPEQITAYVEELRKKTKADIIYHRLPGCKHGEFTPSVRRALTDFIIHSSQF